MKGSSTIVLAAASIASVASAASAVHVVGRSGAENNAARHSVLKANPLASPEKPTASVIRRLDDAADYTNMEFGRCHRVKVREENDDDGGQNFYGGKFHSKTAAFASFFMCNDSTKGTCGSCDYSTEYVMDLSDYLQLTVEYMTNYCDACSAQCRRRLEDGEEDNNDNNNNGGGNMAADCDSCAYTCAKYNGGGDEANYLGCQAAYQDDEGNQLYSAPTCDPDTGDIIIDMFYDDECQIKHYVGNYYGFSYDTFSMIESSCVDCAYSNGLCGNMYQYAYHCVNGNNQNGNVAENDDISACKSFKQAFAERIYHKRKKTSPVFAIIVFALTLSMCFAFGSYTYYIRHKDSKTPLASLDHGDGTSLPQGQMA